MLRLRQSPFTKGGWGLTYANKTREAQVLLAGSIMKDLPRNRAVQMGYKTYYPFSCISEYNSETLNVECRSYYLSNLRFHCFHCPF